MSIPLSPLKNNMRAAGSCGLTLSPTLVPYQPLQNRNMAGRFTDDQISEFRGTFGLLDHDGDGYITAKDLETLMGTFGQVPTESELRDMFDKVDAGHNGAVDFQDFLNLMARRMEELKEALQRVDLNRDGFISTDELRQVLTTLWGQLTDEDANELIRAANVAGHDKISYKEFLRFMTTDLPDSSDGPPHGL